MTLSSLLQVIYRELDQNNDGLIQAKELYKKISLNKETEQLVVDLLQVTEVDPSKLTFPDFLIFICKRKGHQSRNTNIMREVFEVLNIYIFQ